MFQNSNSFFFHMSFICYINYLLLKRRFVGFKSFVTLLEILMKILQMIVIVIGKIVMILHLEYGSICNIFRDIKENITHDRKCYNYC